MNCGGGIINIMGVVKTLLAVSHDTLNRFNPEDFKFYN